MVESYCRQCLSIRIFDYPSCQLTFREISPLRYCFVSEKLPKLYSRIIFRAFKKCPYRQDGPKSYYQTVRKKYPPGKEEVSSFYEVLPTLHQIFCNERISLEKKGHCPKLKQSDRLLCYHGTTHQKRLVPQEEFTFRHFLISDHPYK